VTSVELPADPASASAVRALVRRALAPQCPADVVDVAALLASELVTNAILHARSPARVTVTPGPHAVRVEVGDHSSTPPRVRDFAPEASTGRGLQMIDALADAWGVEPDGAGKIVWFELSPSGVARGSATTDESHRG
jgi:anti-sigma regulatory factor (Ser/Thr protein kinase)